MTAWVSDGWDLHAVGVFHYERPNSEHRKEGYHVEVRLRVGQMARRDDSLMAR